uniref:2-keto-4-pentenoate hydratase n=1 Tax=Candidatus Kentrum sp. TUN TaxID=2126343 RepID=A0A450ZBU8_9GAMM|nr:MAG: 2-keto-4-pentenoate hydratase [Candidatus Kentron sp. TUN]VFK52604.1 MAG: 2-keto-4-pentenoate hydratase [Candidatus Kentron sp. TUN]VFK53101.1 MAG: 2-keto-4-pentenoate hydratase [Candidatus Kentron sp. TUN]
MKKPFTMIAVLWFFIAASPRGQEPNFADIILQTEDAYRPIPVLSSQYPAMDLHMAYAIQKTYIRKKLSNETLAGFKAGLTSKKGQKKFGIHAPIAGALFVSGKLTGEAIVDSAIFYRPMIETEIGFIVGASLTRPVKDTATLKKSIQAIAPVIELPDLRFADTKRLTGVDIIAANAAAKQFIVGHPKPVDTVDPNAVAVVLLRGEHEINRGKGKDALGDQWQAVLWLVNTMTGQGWTIQPGQILLTGALGKMLPGKPGKYLADYGDLGKITFRIK